MIKILLSLLSCSYKKIPIMGNYDEGVIDCDLPVELAQAIKNGPV